MKYGPWVFRSVCVDCAYVTKRATQLCPHCGEHSRWSAVQFDTVVMREAWPRWRPWAVHWEVKDAS